MAVYIHEFPNFFAKSIFPDGCSTFIAFHEFQNFCEKLYDKAFLFFSFACLSAGELDNALSPLTLNQCQPRRPTNQSVRPQSQTTHKQSPTNQEPRHNLVERASVARASDQASRRNACLTQQLYLEPYGDLFNLYDAVPTSNLKEGTEK